MIRARAFAVLRFALDYGLVALLGMTVLQVVFSAMAFGERPRPFSPPPGFRSEVVEVDLRWQRGDGREPLQLQISDTPAFSKIVYEHRVTGTRHSVSKLTRGRRYWWRLQQDSGAPIGSFVLAADAVRF